MKPRRPARVAGAPAAKGASVQLAAWEAAYNQGVVHEGAVRLEEAAMGEMSPDHVPGLNFFWEHVHFDFAGVYAFARAMADPAWILRPPRKPGGRRIQAGRYNLSTSNPYNAQLPLVRSGLLGPVRIQSTLTEAPN